MLNKLDPIVVRANWALGILHLPFQSYIMGMNTLQDLLKRNDPETVADRIAALYPGQASMRDDYLAQYLKCLHLEPVADSPQMTLVVRVCPAEPEFDEEDSVDIAGSTGQSRRQYYLEDNGPDAHMHNPEDPHWDEPESFGLSFTPWNKWCAMPFSDESLTKFSEVDLLAHALWEMSWHGFDEIAIEERLEGIKRSADECRDGTQESYTAEEFLKIMDSWKAEPPEDGQQPLE